LRRPMVAELLRVLRGNNRNEPLGQWSESVIAALTEVWPGASPLPVRP
jgi:hypothetical protein